MTYDPAEELGQTFDKRRVALRRHHDFKTSRLRFHIDLKVNVTTYKCPRVLMHGWSSTYGFTKSVLDKLGRGEIWKSLSKIDGFVVGSQLGELHPGDRNQIRYFRLLKCHHRGSVQPDCLVRRLKGTEQTLRLLSNWLTKMTSFWTGHQQSLHVNHTLILYRALLNYSVRELSFCRSWLTISGEEGSWRNTAQVSPEYIFINNLYVNTFPITHHSLFTDVVHLTAPVKFLWELFAYTAKREEIVKA